MRSFLTALLLVVVLLVIACGAAVFWIGSRGLSARAQPGRVESAVAGTMQRLAIPRGARDRRNPMVRTPEMIEEGMEHYADHCASCHANDGSGDTEMGRGLYPKTPDMRQAGTQALTDGELFYIIENGVRLTGMPAWSTGTPDGEAASWHLVLFIRELPRLTPSQIEHMKQFNPRSPAEIRRQIEEEQFLAGDTK